jgi:hypothetical protein
LHASSALDEIFDRYDSDGDGFLTLREALKLCELWVGSDAQEQSTQAERDLARGRKSRLSLRDLSQFVAWLVPVDPLAVQSLFRRCLSASSRGTPVTFAVLRSGYSRSFELVDKQARESLRLRKKGKALLLPFRGAAQPPANKQQQQQQEVKSPETREDDEGESPDELPSTCGSVNTTRHRGAQCSLMLLFSALVVQGSWTSKPKF